MSKITTYLKRAALGVAAAALVACGSGTGDCPPGQNGNLTLSLTAPNQYPAGVAVTAYLTMTNTSTVNASNLSYAVPDASNYTGATITVANGATNPCYNIAAGASCTFPAQIAAIPASHPGSFTVTATPGGNSGNSAKLQATVRGLFSTLETKLGLNAGNTLSLTANIGLTTVPTNANSGANGISFLYSNTIAANKSGDTLLSVVAVVNSATAGAFNTINLTDANGNLLNFTTLSGNSASQATNLVNGSIVTFLLTIPAGTTSYQFYAQTMENGTKVDQGTIANPIGITNATYGVLAVQPSNFELSAAASYTSQTVTYTNIGNGEVSGFSVTAPSAPLTLSSNNCGSTLAAGQSCTVVLISNAPAGTSGTGSLTANYTNGGGSNNPITSQYNYAGVGAVSGISLEAVNNFIFTANTVNTSQATQVTLKNTGNVSESSFVFTLPDYFTLAAGTTGTPCVVTDGNTVAAALASNSSCTLTLTYTQASVTAQSVTSLSVNYKYNGSTAASPPASKILTYSTVQAAGVLQVTSPTNVSPYVFSSILANNIESQTQTFTVTNVGTGPATNIVNVGLLSGPSGKVFTIINSTPSGSECGSGKTTLQPNETCLLTVRFGPTALQSGLQSKILELTYTPYTSAAASTLDISMQGTLIAPLQANPSIDSITVSNSVCVGACGSSELPFAVPASSSASAITLTYKNTGEYEASGFTVDTSSLGNGYTLTTDNCNDITLPVNASCTVILSLTPTTAGSQNLDLGSLVMAYTDQRGSTISGVPSSWNDGQTTAYLTVFAPAAVTAVLSSESSGSPMITSTEPNSTFYVVFTLTGGYNMQSTTYTVGALPSGFTFVNGSSCSVDSINSTCPVAITAPANGSTGNTFTVTGSNPIPTTSPSPLTLDVTVNP